MHFSRMWAAPFPIGGLLLLALNPVARGQPLLPVGIPTATFDITDYGASPSNTASANAADIQAAISACMSAGGGTVVVPSGTFVSNPISINGGDMDLEINGTLQAPAESAYPNASTNFITWSNGKNVELSGSGTIDGQGATWWTAGSGGEPLATRPELIHFSNPETLLVTGISVINSPKEFFSFGGNGTKNVTFDDMSINAPGDAPNTDGIDVDGADFLIENSTISTGDDDIAMTAFSGNAPVNNVTITNMTFGTGHGVSVGDEIGLGVSNVTVSNSTFDGTEYGIRLKSGRGNGGLAENLTYNNITMTDVPNPIYISSWYDSSTGGFEYPDDPASATTAAFNSSTTPQWQNITISNLTSTDDVDFDSIAGLIYGLPESLVQGVTLDNVNITAEYGMAVDYAGTDSAPVEWLGNSTMDVLSGGPEFGTYAYPNYFPGPMDGGIYDSVLVVPEPASFGVIAVMGLGCLARRKRKRIG